MGADPTHPPMGGGSPPTHMGAPPKQGQTPAPLMRFKPRPLPPQATPPPSTCPAPSLGPAHPRRAHHFPRRGAASFRPPPKLQFSRPLAGNKRVNGLKGGLKDPPKFLGRDSHLFSPVFNPFF